MKKINLYKVLQFLRNKMQAEKQANYNVKVRQYNYSYYSLIKTYCVDNWDLSKEFLEDQSKDLKEKFDTDMMIELEKFNSAG